MSELPDFELGLVPAEDRGDVAYPDAVGVMVTMNSVDARSFNPIVEWRDWGLRPDGRWGWRQQRTTHLTPDTIKLVESEPPRASQYAGFEYDLSGLRYFWDNEARFCSGPFSNATQSRRDARSDAEDALRYMKTNYGFVTPTKAETYRIISDLNNNGEEVT